MKNNFVFTTGHVLIAVANTSANNNNTNLDYTNTLVLVIGKKKKLADSFSFPDHVWTKCIMNMEAPSLLILPFIFLQL